MQILRMSARHGWLAFAITLLAILAAAPATAWFEHYQPEVTITAPFLDLRTGPGRGYPVFHIVEAGETITLLKRRTGWVRVRAARGKEGWLRESELSGTIDVSGTPPEVSRRGHDAFVARRWEFGFGVADFAGAAALSAHAGFGLTPNIMLQLEGSQILGDFSDGLMGIGSLLLSPFPQWRASPFFSIGTGIIRTKPQTTIIRSEDRTDEIVHAGAGANVFLTDRFILRIEYRRHTVLTSRDENEELDQWKAGFSVYF